MSNRIRAGAVGTGVALASGAAVVLATGALAADPTPAPSSPGAPAPTEPDARGWDRGDCPDKGGGSGRAPESPAPNSGASQVSVV